MGIPVAPDWRPVDSGFAYVSKLQKIPRVLWARAHILSTRHLLIACFGLLVLEYRVFPVVSYFKLIVVPLWYSMNVLAVAAPASYAIAFDRAKALSPVAPSKPATSEPSLMFGQQRRI